MPVESSSVSVMANDTHPTQTTLLSSFPSATVWRALALPPFVSNGKAVRVTVPSSGVLFAKQLQAHECYRSESLAITVPKKVTFDWVSLLLRNSYPFVTTLTMTGETSVCG